MNGSARNDANVEPDPKPLSRRNFFQLSGGVLAAGAGASVLSACGSSGSSTKSSGGGTTKNGKTTLNLMSWEQFEVAEKAAWFKVINQFEAAHPNITVKWVGWPFATYDQNVVTQAEAGSVNADVVMCPPELASALITKFNMCVPLQSITDDLKLTPIPAHEQFMNGSNLEGLGIIDVPFALTYDQALLKKAGFSAPPTTLDEWLTQAEKLTNSPNTFGVALLNSVADGADWWNQVQNFPLAYGGTWAKGKTLTFTSEPVVNSIKYFVELLNKGGPKGSSEAAITKLWESDRIAMNLNVAAGLTSLKTLAPNLYPNLRSAPPPWPGKKAIARLHPATVMKSSKNQDAAMELVKWMVTPKNLYYVTTTNGYPIIPYSNFGTYEPAYAGYLKNTPWMSGYLETNYVGEVDLLGDYTTVYSQIGLIIIKAISSAISGGQTVEAAMAAAQKQAQQELGPQVGA